MLRLFASKLSSACSQFIQQIFNILHYTRFHQVARPPHPCIRLHHIPPPLLCGLIVAVFLHQHHPTSFGSIPKLSRQMPGKALWVVWDSHPLFPPSGFVTTAATPVLSIFTSCSGYAFSISLGSKCAILYSLFLHCFNVNMLHVQICPFSPSKPFTLGSQ